jgi:hypothetical protein
MLGRRVSHSEARWPLLPPTIIRCNATRPNGSRCKREAKDGAVVCDQHGGAAPQVRRRAAEQLIMTADQAAQMLVKMTEDTEVPFGVRAKIAQDLLDRAGLIATQVHQIIPTTEDPVLRFFADIDPRDIVITLPPGSPQPAIETRVDDSPEGDAAPAEILEAAIVDNAEPGNDTPTRIAEMIKAGAFDRKPGNEHAEAPSTGR